MLLNGDLGGFVFFLRQTARNAVFVILCWYSIKNDIPEAALDPCQLKIRQLSPDTFKSGQRTKIILLL